MLYKHYQQRSCGVMYGNGKGVIKDYVTAYAWSNIAISNGNEAASELREDLAKLMIAEQIATAKALASKCLESNYKNCTP